MFSYEHLVEACKNLGLDPLKRGSNEIGAGSRLLSTYPDPFDLKSINFPEEELNQVMKIGEMINNLVSQSKLTPNYNGLKEWKLDEKIKGFISTLEGSLHFWLLKGLKKCSGKKDLTTHNGRVYEVNPEYQKSQQRMNENMRKTHMEFLHMQNKARIANRDRILD